MVQLDTSTQMNSRNKTPLPSPLTAALSDSFPVTPTARHVPAVPHSSVRAIEPNLLAHEVCAKLRIGRTTLYKLVKSGELVPLRVTARIRVWPLSTIEAFLASKEAK